MLFPLPQTPADEPKWTGDVKAFAYYIMPECLPQERFATVYLARKTFEDGSTVTLLRNVPAAGAPSAVPAFGGEGLIERDRTGMATHVRTRVDFIYTGIWSENEFKLDPKRRVLVGSGRNAYVAESDLTLADRSLQLDPLEAAAFGVRTSSWLCSSAIYGNIDRNAPGVGLRFAAGAPWPFAFVLGGHRELFRRVDLTRCWIGSSREGEPVWESGSFLYHLDGTFAAYVIPGFTDTPGTVGAVGGNESGFIPPAAPPSPPPFRLKGKLAQQWVQGLDPHLTPTLSAINGVLVPVPVAPNERETLLDAVPPPTKVPQEPNTPPVP